MQHPTRILSITLALAAVAAAQVQSAPADNLEVIQLAPLRVTADLWEMPLARIPASVSVYDEAALRAGSVRHFGDLVDRIPNLTWTGGTARPRYFQIRGIGENSQFEGETPDSTVRFLVDDLDFTGLGTLGSTFDVQQIEVLRGPQAGAFGANAAAGVVRLVTNAPTPFWTGQVEASAGSDNLLSGAFALGGPLSLKSPETLMMRLAVQQHRSDGFRRNLTLNRDTNARDEFTARLRLTFNPSAAWRWEAGVLFSDFNNGYDEFALDNNGEFTSSDQPGRDEQRSTAVSLRGTYRGFGNVRLTTVTSAAWIDSTYSYDDDWTAASYRGFSDVRRDRTVFNQELRLDSEEGARWGWLDRWTLGAFFARIDEDSAYTNEDPNNLRGLRTTYVSDNFALFGQIAHEFTPQTRLIVGLRAEHIDLKGKGTRTRWRKIPNTFDAVVVTRPRFDDTLIGGKFTLEHALTERHVAFASVTRGYKGGGINVDARINPAVDPLTYDTETLWNYEAGLRGSWLDQQLTGELTLFHLERRNTQVRDSAGFGGNYRFFTDNADRALVTGLEASGSYAFTREWTLNGSLALMDSDLKRPRIPNGSFLGACRLANTPRYGYTLGTRYRAASGFFGSAELVARGEQFDSNNQSQARRAFETVNATLGYAWGDWTFTVWVRNLFDEVYDKRVYFFGNEPPAYTPARYENRADPRQIGVTASFRF
jgi:iron complex outermembrane recepter protein